MRWVTCIRTLGRCTTLTAISAEYQSTLDNTGIPVIVSRRGNCWDNAVAESFFATLEIELIDCRAWGSRIELRGEVSCA